MSNEIIDLKKGKLESSTDRTNFRQDFRGPPNNKPPSLNEVLTTEELENILQDLTSDYDSNPEISEGKEEEVDIENQNDP